MRSAIDFLPSSMTLLITCWSSLDRWIGSASSGRTWAAARRGIWLSFLHAVLRARLLAVAHAGRVERPAHDLVAHPRKVLDAPPAHEHDRVLLQVVPLAGDVGGHLDRTRDAHARHLAQRGVGLLRRGRVHARAHATALRRGDLLLAPAARLQAGSGQLLLRYDAALAHELRGGGHRALMLAAPGVHEQVLVALTARARG